jgi:hypothetical protein
MVQSLSTASSEGKLGISERQILRRIFGPVYENDLGWRRRRNEDLYELLGGPNIAKVYKYYNGVLI